MRVVITGFGIVCGLGYGAKNVWDLIVSGTSSVNTISRFSTDNLSSHKAALIYQDPTDFYLKSSKARRMSTIGRDAIATTNMAIMDAGLNLNELNLKRVGVISESSSSHFGTYDFWESIISDGVGGVAPYQFTNSIPNIAAAEVSIQFGLHGPNTTLHGVGGIGYAYDLIKHDQSDILLVLGIERLHDKTYRSFSEMGFIANENESCGEVSRPFDSRSCGPILGESIVVVVMESLEHAKARDSHIYAEVLGYGMANDGLPLDRSIGPFVGSSIRGAMSKAFSDAKVDPSDIHYISAMANSSSTLDLNEVQAFFDLYKSNAEDTPISSIKAAVGETMAASGCLNLFSGCYSIYTQILPPTLNFALEMQGYDVDCVPNQSRSKKVEAVQVNSFEVFNGTSSSIILCKPN